MAKLPLYAAGITASFTILLTAAAAQEVIEVFARGCEPRWRPMPSRVDTS